MFNCPRIEKGGNSSVIIVFCTPGEGIINWHPGTVQVHLAMAGTFP